MLCGIITTVHLCIAKTGHLYTFNHMSSGLITCVCQDNYGFIWIGTEHGLNKFDGYRFTSYFHNRQDSSTLTNNEISALFTDRQGHLWVGCSKGLSRYDYEHDNFQRYTFPERLTPRISALTETREGKLLIGTAGYGLYSLNRQGTIDYESPFNQRQSNHFCSRIYIDRQGHLWHSNHLPTFTRFKLKAGQPTASAIFQSEAGQPVQFVEYSDRQLLIVCMYGIYCFDYQNETLTEMPFDLSILNGHNIGIEDATLDNEGNLILGTSGYGLMKIGRHDRRLSSVEYHNSQIDLGTANVVDLMVDKDQNLWTACYNKGLLKLTSQQEPFHSWNFANQQYVTGGGISAITESADGNIWCAVQNGGIFKLNRQGKIIAHPQSPAGTRLIFRSRNDQYWLTTKNVLYRYHPETGTATEELELKGRGLDCMAEDQHGKLYISTFGMGLYVYDPINRSGELLSMRQEHRTGGHLCNDWIKAMMTDRRGVLWIATTSGVSAMLTDTGAFDRFGWHVILDGQQCYALCELPGGDILIGSEGGLYRYWHGKNKAERVAGSELLSDKMICAMANDGHGNIWISTTMGLWQYHVSKGLFTGHVTSNGLTSKAFMQGVTTRGVDGSIYFGTADGVVRFLPSEVSQYRYVPGQAHLTRFVVGKRSLNTMHDHFLLDTDENTFTLDFSLLDYSSTDNISFQYRLNNDSKWLQTPEGSNQLTFIQLAPGKYKLDVRAVGSQGDRSPVSTPVTTLYITIRTPWYKTWWANVGFLIVVLCFVGLIAFGWRGYQQEKRLTVTINTLKKNMKWLHRRFFGDMEQQGQIAPVRVKGNDDTLMERVVKCINENLSNPDFSVETLTQEVGISRSHLHRKMKELTGLSTSEFIRNLRLQQAARLIRERKINITQITYSVGFNNQAHFSTVFRKHYGMTPTEYANSKEKRTLEQKETTMQHAKTDN